MGALDTASFAVNLADKASPAAKMMSGSIGDVEKALKKTGGAAEGAAGKMGASAGKAGVSMAGLAKMAGGAAIAIGAAMAVAAGAAGLYAVKQMGAAETAGFALEAIIGDSKKAQDALQAANKFSNFFGIDPTETTKRLTALVNKGYEVSDAFKIMQGSMDLGVITGDAKKLEAVFAQMSAKGKVEGEAVAQLAEAGVNPEKLRKILLGGLASTSGNATKDIEAAIAGGQINVAKLQSAALVAIQQTTGKELGGLALQGSRTLDGLIKQFETLPARLIQTADTSAAFDPLKKGLANVLDLLNPENPGGQKILAVIERVSASVGAMLESISADDIANAIEFIGDAFTVTGDVIGWVVDTLKSVWDELKTGFADATAGGGEFAMGAIEIKDVVAGLGTVLNVTARVVGFTAGVIYALVDSIVSLAVWTKDGIDSFRRTISWQNWGPGFIDGIASLPGKVADAFNDLFGYLGDAANIVVDKVFDIGSSILTGIWDGLLWAWDGFTDAVTGVGTSIVDGIWKGLKDAWAGLLKNLKDLTALLPDGVKKILGIASPSKIFMEIGQQTVAGLTVGIEQASDEPSQAMQDAANQMIGAGNVSNDNSRTVAPNIYITVYGSDPVNTAAEVRRELSGVFSNMQILAGA